MIIPNLFHVGHIIMNTDYVPIYVLCLTFSRNEVIIVVVKNLWNLAADDNTDDERRHNIGQDAIA